MNVPLILKVREIIFFVWGKTYNVAFLGIFDFQNQRCLGIFMSQREREREREREKRERERESYSESESESMRERER
jgi:hypothetical protein